MVSSFPRWSKQFVIITLWSEIFYLQYVKYRSAVSNTRRVYVLNCIFRKILLKLPQYRYQRFFYSFLITIISKCNLYSPIHAIFLKFYTLCSDYGILPSTDITIANSTTRDLQTGFPCRLRKCCIRADLVQALNQPYSPVQVQRYEFFLQLICTGTKTILRSMHNAMLRRMYKISN